MKKRLLVSFVSFLFLGCFLFASGNVETSEENTPVSVEPIQSAAEENIVFKEKEMIDLLQQTFYSCFEDKNYEGVYSAFAEMAMISQTTEVEAEYAQKTYSLMQDEIDSFLGSFSFEEVNVPSAAICGKAFKSAFKVSLSSSVDGFNPSSIDVIVEYPALDPEGNKVVATKRIVPSSTGEIVFESPVTSFATKSSVTFRLDLPNVFYQNFENAPKISLDYKVSTNLKASGGSIAVVDYNKSGKVITSDSATSSAILTALINKGFIGIGNCDFTSAVTSGNDATVQKEAQALFQGSVTYLVYGTVKYELAEKVDSGYRIVLNGTIKVRNIKKNTELLNISVVADATEKTEWAALNAARKQLASIVSENILYGM